MVIHLRRLTALEHYLCASLLSVVITSICADETVPYASHLRTNGFTSLALVETALPIILFLSGLVVLLPRTGNESRIAIFRFIGRYPLLVRYFIVVLPFVGIQKSIEKFLG
jgi:hypothetical protein